MDEKKKINEVIYNSSMRDQKYNSDILITHLPLLWDLNVKTEGGEGENSTGRWGGSNSPASIPTTSLIVGRIAGDRWRQWSAMVMQSNTCS